MARDFNDALNQFRLAAYELSSEWDKADHTGTFFIDGYPFDKSLDDVVNDIQNWYEVQIADN